MNKLTANQQEIINNLTLEFNSINEQKNHVGTDILAYIEEAINASAAIKKEVDQYNKLQAIIRDETGDTLLNMLIPIVDNYNIKVTRSYENMHLGMDIPYKDRVKSKGFCIESMATFEQTDVHIKKTFSGFRISANSAYYGEAKKPVDDLYTNDLSEIIKFVADWVIYYHKQQQASLK